jgi:hypothetical protein
MAGDPPSHRKRKAAAPAAAAEDEAEPVAEEVQELRREVEELEEGLADLDRRILEHLRGTSTRLVDAAVARLAALRPPASLGTPLFLPCSRILGFGSSPLVLWRLCNLFSNRP